MAAMQVDVAIVGGGPAGLAAAHAVLAARPGARVAVLERSDLRPRGAHILMQPSGVRALAAVRPELKEALALHHLDHQCTRRFSDAGELLHSSDSGSLTAAIRERGEIISLPWHVLQRELAAALPPNILHLNHRFLRYTETPDGVAADFEGPEGERRVQAALLVGCDGSQSLVREQLLGDGPPQYIGKAIWRAVRPQPADWVLEHGWAAWGGAAPKATLMTSTLRNGQIAWQIFKHWPAEDLHTIGGGRRAYVQEEGAADAPDRQPAASSSSGTGRSTGEERRLRALAAVEGFPQIVVDLIAGTDPSAITEHGQFYRDPEQCQEYVRGRVGLVGDAAHLATPMLGMGCSLALEDALELGRAVGQHGPTPEALAAYQTVRVPLSGEVQAASVQLYKDLIAGTLKGAFNEFDICIERGFADRTFEPLVAAASAAPAVAV